MNTSLKRWCWLRSVTIALGLGMVVATLVLPAYTAPAEDSDRPGNESRGGPDGGRPDGPPPPPPPHPLLVALDKDHDGTISPEEIKQASASLIAIDRDGDGKLSRKLAHRDPVPAAAQGMSQVHKLRVLTLRLPTVLRSGAGKTLVNRNADVRTTVSAETLGGPATLRPPPPPPPSPLQMVLDKDRDGTISADEIKQASKSLLTLDRNRDGKLSREELRPPRPGPGGRPRGGPGRRGPGPDGPPPPFGPPPDGPYDQGPGGPPPDDR